MDLFKPLLLIGGALLIYGAVKAAKFYNGLAIDFQKISIGGSVLSPKVYVTLRVNNNSNAAASINSIIGKLLYQGKYVADVVSSQPVRVESDSVMYLDLELQSLLPNVLELISTVVGDRKLKNQFSFDGRINISGVELPVNLPLQW